MVRFTRVRFITPKVLPLGVLSLFVLSACQQAVVSGPRFTSENGVAIETLLPADLFMLAKFGTNDQQQIDNLKLLNGYFPNNPMGLIVQEFNDGFKSGASLEEMGLNYETDLLPILKEQSEVFFALAPGEGDSLDKVKGVLAVTLGDIGKMDKLLQVQVDKATFKKEQYNGQDYFSEVSDEISSIFVTRVEDTLFIATDLGTMQRGIDGYKNGQNVLINNRVYQRAIADYRSSVGFLYGDFSRLMDFISKAGTDGQTIADSLNTVGLDESGISAIESQTILITVEKEGIRLVVNVKAKGGADLQNVAGNVEKAYLLNRIPAKYPVLYAEGYNLSQSYESFAKLAISDGDLQTGLQEFEQFFAGVGLDFQKDILTFLNKGYAIVLEDTDSVFPSLGIYVDVSGNVVGAEKTLARIDDGFNMLWEQAKSEAPEISMVASLEEVVAGKLWKFRLNLDTLVAGQSANMVKKLSGQKVEFYYGLLPDKTLVFALKPDLEKVYGGAPKVADGAEFKQALSYLADAEYGVSFLAPAQVLSYFDRVIDLAKTEGLSATDFAEYENVKAYIKPIKSLVTASRSPDKSQTTVEAFLHIAQ